MKDESSSNEVSISIKYSPLDRYFDISVPVGRNPLGTEAVNPQVERLRLSFDKFVNADGELLQAVGRMVQACALSGLLGEGVSDRDARAIGASMEAANRPSRGEEDLIASAIRRVIVSRMVRMTDPDEKALSLSDFPKLFDAALLFGYEDALKLKQRWPRIRRQLAALSVERDFEKRKVLLGKFQDALMGA